MKRGGAEVVWRAHNPQVGGSKPPSAECVSSSHSLDFLFLNFYALFENLIIDRMKFDGENEQKE